MTASEEVLSRSNCCLSSELDSAGGTGSSDLRPVSSSWDKMKDGFRPGISTNPAARDQERAKFSRLLAPPAWVRELIRTEREDL